MPKKTMTFEEAMARLEEILNALETGSETLDASLKLYEEGIRFKGDITRISYIRKCLTHGIKAYLLGAGKIMKIGYIINVMHVEAPKRLAAYLADSKIGLSARQGNVTYVKANGKRLGI